MSGFPFKPMFGFLANVKISKKVCALGSSDFGTLKYVLQADLNCGKILR
jgi:hypothetical protein